LECAVTRDKLGEEEIGDFESLERAFGTDLREGVRKGRININMARVAVGKYKGFTGVLRRIGIVGGGVERKREEEIGREEGCTEGKEEAGDKGEFGGKEKRRDEEVEKREFGGKEENRQDEEVENEGCDRQRRKWDDEGAQGDRNWAWKQSEKERIRSLKKAFLDRKKEREEKEESEEERREEKKMKGRDKDEEELVGEFEKSLSAVEYGKE